PENNLNFGFTPAKEIQRRFFLIWWNVYNFFVTYANLDNWQPEVKLRTPNPEPRHVLDRWVLSRLSSLVELSTSSLNSFDAMTASRALEQFVVGDVSTWYLRRSRDRVGPAALVSEDKPRFYATMLEVLLTSLKL